MIESLLLGFFAGIVFWNSFLTYIDPIIQLKQEVYKYKKTDEATYYNLSSQRQTYDFYKEYPEAKDQPEENTNAIGFEYYPQSEFDDEYDGDDEFEDKEIKMGF